jgi:hypothetical protein
VVGRGSRIIYALSGAAGFALGGVKLVRKPCRAVGLALVQGLEFVLVLVVDWCGTLYRA